MNEIDDDMNAIARTEHIDRMIKAVPKTVFGDLYRALLHSWQLQYANGTPTGDLSTKSLFERVHEDFVAILKTANLGDLVEKLHDALAKQAQGVSES